MDKPKADSSNYDKPISVTDAKNVVAGADGKSGLLTQSTGLDKAASVRDLQALAVAGLDFGANSGNVIHRSLGQQVNVIGKKGVEYKGSDYSADNVATMTDEDNNIIVGLKKSPRFETLELGKNDEPHITLTPDAGNNTLTFSRTPAAGEGANADDKVVVKGIKDGDTPDSAVTKGLFDKLKELLGLNGKNGQDGKSSTGPAGKDGLDGKPITDKVEALRNGDAGPVVYVDDKGNRVVTGKDGKLYKPSELENKVYVDGEGYVPADKAEIDPTTNIAKLKDGETVSDGEKATALPDDTKLHHALVNKADGSTTEPSKLSNVGNGAINDKSTDAVNGRQVKDILNNLGVETNDDGSIKQPTITAIKGEDGKDGKSAKTVVEGLNDVISTVNKGLKYNADQVAEGSEGKTQQLGSTLSVVSGDIKDSEGNITHRGNNLRTEYSYDNGNGTVTIGLKDELTDIKSISGGKDNKAKVELTDEGVKLSHNDATITVAKDGEANTAKLTGLTDRTIDSNGFGEAGRAATESAVKDLANKLGFGGDTKPSNPDSPAGKDGLDGKNIAEKAEALRNGEAGNVVYTNKAGDRVVTGQDGKSYAMKDLNDKVYVDGKGYFDKDAVETGVDENGKPTVALKNADATPVAAIDPKDIKHSLVNRDGSTTEPSVLSNVGDGDISSTSTDAVNGKQVKDILDGLGIDVKDGKVQAPTINAIKGVDGKDGTDGQNGKVVTVVDGLNNVIDTVNKGLIFGADNEADNKTQQLGSSLSVKSAEEALTKKGSDAKFVGDNLVTHYDNTNGNGTVSIGLSDKPNFTEVNAGNVNVKDHIIVGKDGKDGEKGDKLEIGSNNIEFKPGKPEIDKDGNPVYTGVIKGLADLGDNADKSSAANKGYVDTQVERLTDKGLNFAGNDNVTVSKKLGETLSIKGEGVDSTTAFTSASGNIKVAAVEKGTDGKETALEVRLSDKLRNIVSIETPDLNNGDNGKPRVTEKITLDKDGIHVVTKDGPSSHVTKDGLSVKDKNGQDLVKLSTDENNNPSLKFAKDPQGNGTGVITGLATPDGKDKTAAANVQYVQDNVKALGKDINRVDNRVSALDRRVSRVEDRANAGIAGAVATASLPQVYKDGKSMVSAAAGSFRNQAAIAVGYSKSSDNGKIVLKLNAHANTNGDVSTGVGVGYQW